MAFGRLPTMSGEFRVAKDPELRFQPNGDAVCTIWCVTNSQKKDEATNQWKDDKTLWLKVTLWKNDGAENAANSIQKSDLVAVVCEPYLNTFVKNGETKTFLETNRVISFGPSIRFRVMQHGAQQGQQQAPPQDNPTGSNLNRGDGGSMDGSDWGTGQTEEPPF